MESIYLLFAVLLQNPLTGAELSPHKHRSILSSGSATQLVCNMAAHSVFELHGEPLAERMNEQLEWLNDFRRIWLSALMPVGHIYMNSKLFYEQNEKTLKKSTTKK